MDLNRLRGPLLAAMAALLIGGASVVLANSHQAPTQPPASETESQAPETESEPAEAADTDTLEAGDQAGADDDAQDPSYAGIATIPIDESAMPEDEAAEAQALAALATVSQADAESAALAAVSGEIVQTELDNENGYLVWSVEIRDSAGTVSDVKIDAGSGAVLGTQADEDAGEAGAED